MQRIRICVSGIVQGVGFRPFLFRLAERCHVAGWVRNHSAEVEIEIEGHQAAVDHFLASLQNEAPPLAVITSLTTAILPVAGDSGFVIRTSTGSHPQTPLISPDIATCSDCRQDIADPHNRRYRYPFTNCTNCGPRYTIITGVPYDRAATTMKMFAMCDKCRQEYEDPQSRRFHAQPNACPECGPAYTLLDNNGREVAAADMLTAASQFIQAGKILAIKGLGGYHLACDARNETAVRELRSRKTREDKPFAVMCASLAAAHKLCHISPAAEKLLTSPAHPIVLLEKCPGYNLAAAVAPGNRRVGVMLPYTPAHELLLAGNAVWVMTSGNRSDEPLAYLDDEALTRLSDIADYFLTHNRPIERRADDSVAQIFQNNAFLLRRSRGYTPLPVSLPQSQPEILACGGELKNTFCLTYQDRAFLSAHIGDLENVPTYSYYTQSIAHYCRLLHITPQAAAYDLHPEYLSTKYAHSLTIPHIAVQHHHAHIAGVMAEHQLKGPVLGIAFDGTGYGTDGTLWGGEFLIADYHTFTRVAHCRYLPLPGGTKAIKEPWRPALWVLSQLYGEKLADLSLPLLASLPDGWPLILQMAEKGLNSPQTSSAGRLFDIAAALCGIRSSVNYEGQAAIELELAAGNMPGSLLPYDIKAGTICELDFLPTFAAVVEKIQLGHSLADISSAFHSTVAAATCDMAGKISRTSGITKVALSGGVFQNLRLLTEVTDALSRAGLDVYCNHETPPNDGGLSFGQAVIAGAKLARP